MADASMHLLGNVFTGANPNYVLWVQLDRWGPTQAPADGPVPGEKTVIITDTRSPSRRASYGLGGCVHLS